MTQQQTATILRELDACNATFTVLAHLLENNVGVADLYPLAVLAEEGRRKTDAIADMLGSIGSFAQYQPDLH